MVQSPHAAGALPADSAIPTQAECAVSSMVTALELVTACFPEGRASAPAANRQGSGAVGFSCPAEPSLWSTLRQASTLHTACFQVP